jgi:hypothetical protein
MKAKPAKPTATELPPSAIEVRIQSWTRHPLAYVIASALLLLPCFWQSRIQAGDLSSHIYNAWLAQLIESGKTIGLQLAPRTTNVLFDLELSALMRAFSVAAAQRIAVSLAVLIFVWGAFYFVSRVSGRRPWFLLPVLAILAYGWTFHMGFFNMYLSLGLCFWAIGAAWDAKPAGLGIAAVLLVVAYVTHGLPVAWAVALGAYTWAARRTPAARLPQLLLAGVAAIVALKFLIENATITRWSSRQALGAMAADQGWVYDDKYIVIAVGLVVLWALLFFSLWREKGSAVLFRSVPFHFAALTAVGIAVLPTAVAVPGFQQGLTFIAERMSLALGVCYCAAVARTRLFTVPAVLAMLLMLGYFGLLYRDDRVLNGYEDRIAQAVATLHGQRVVTGFNGDGLRTDPFLHMVDRACLGLCYSYANYEPSTWQFRVRATGPNPIVASNYSDSFRLQTGRYVVKPSDLPLYRLDLDATGGIIVHSLPAGQPNGMVTFTAIP